MYYIYILTNEYNTTLYVGVTNNLSRRLYEHQQKYVHGFTKQYNLNKLVYFEEYTNIQEALHREKQLKNWHREWKMNLIKSMNPELNDLMGS